MALDVCIKKSFGEFVLDVAFESSGGCMGILGASGCGKSMTLKCIAGIEQPDWGKIVLNGRTLFDSEKGISLRPQERKVGYLFQDYALFPTMTVGDNIQIGMRGTKEEKSLRLSKELERFQLQGLEKRYPAQLSGGQQQRAALARMLVCDPDILLLDEPFSALDGYLKDAVRMELQELIKDYRKDTLLVTHNRDEIYQFCDAMTILAQGKMILSGNTREVFKNPRKVEAARLTGCKNISKARKAGERQLEAMDWNITLNTCEPVTEEVAYVGIRAHHLTPCWKAGEENSMRIKAAGYAEAPFKKQYLFVNAEQESSRIWWLVNQSSITQEYNLKIPPYMIFPKESLLLLTS